MQQRKRPRDEDTAIATADEKQQQPPPPPPPPPLAGERAVDAARTLALERKLASMEALEADLDERMRQHGIHLREMATRVSHRILRVHATPLYEPVEPGSSDRWAGFPLSSLSFAQ